MSLDGAALPSRARPSQPKGQQSTFDLARIAETEWRILRRVRLEALSTSPTAFVGTYGWEWFRLRGFWRRRARSAAWMVARSGDRVIGLLALPAASPAEDGARFVESVWVHPDLRGQGVLRSMIGVVEEVARQDGARRLLLWVLGENEAAWDAYLGVGFRPTGLVQPITVGRKRDVERQMVKYLT